MKCDSSVQQRVAANKFRDRMTRAGTLVVRLISSPGSGKTVLLERTAKELAQSCKVAVLVGDVETDRDTQRLSPIVPTVQMTTGDKCHLEFPLVERAFSKLKESRIDVLFIEDVGNLICAPSHDLGEHVRVLLLSTTEGDDKPGKYPKAFRTSEVLLITKMDLLPYVPFSVKQAEKDARKVHPGIKVFTLSAQNDDGIDAWFAYLNRERRRLMTAARTDRAKPSFPLPSPSTRTKRQSISNRDRAKPTKPPGSAGNSRDQLKSR